MPIGKIMDQKMEPKSRQGTKIRLSKKTFFLLGGIILVALFATSVVAFTNYTNSKNEEQILLEKKIEEQGKIASDYILGRNLKKKPPLKNSSMKIEEAVSASGETTKIVKIFYTVPTPSGPNDWNSLANTSNIYMNILDQGLVPNDDDQKDYVNSCVEKPETDKAYRILDCNASGTKYTVTSNRETKETSVEISITKEALDNYHQPNLGILGGRTDKVWTDCEIWKKIPEAPGMKKRVKEECQGK